MISENSTITFGVLLAVIAGVFTIFKFMDAQFASLRRETDGKLGGLEDRESKQRHAMRNEMTAQIGKLEISMNERLGRLELKMDAFAAVGADVRVLNSQVADLIKKIDRLADARGGGVAA